MPQGFDAVTSSPNGPGENSDLEAVSREIKQAVTELFATGPVRAGEILVVGCSSSEVIGAEIGKESRQEIGRVLVSALLEVLEPYGVYLAAQCCEHLNRALVVEEEAAVKYGWEAVSVVPVPQAGGSFASAARELFQHPVVVEEIKAHWGLDIGDTFIGMHLKPVVIPVRLRIKKIGQAHLTAARTRAKLIGGPRAVYE